MHSIGQTLLVVDKTAQATKLHDNYLWTYGYVALLGRHSGKSHAHSIWDELGRYVNPALHELPIDELDAKLKAEWDIIQKRKKLVSSRSWRDKRKGFSGHYGGKYGQ